MRVTLVTETYAPQVNGVSRTLGQLVRCLEGRGDVVQVVHPDYGEASPGKNVHLARSISLPFYKELFLPLPPFGAVHRAIRDFAPEVVHIATEATLGLSVLRTMSGGKAPVVSSFHTNFDQYSAHYRVGFTSGTIWRYLRWFHNRTLETYVPSRVTIADLESRGFERLVLWPRGVDSTLFRPDRPGRDEVRASYGFKAGDVVVAYVGRIAAEKNIGYLADALAELLAIRPDVKVMFVGDGPARADVERRMAGKAVFAGYRSGADLADHYAAADLFAFSSLTETFGNVVLEAMASGLPVVALRGGGVGNIVRSGQTGTLVEPDEPSGTFARELVALIDNHTERVKRAEAARDYALSQSWGEIMGTLRERYRSVIEATSPNPVGSR